VPAGGGVTGLGDATLEQRQVELVRGDPQLIAGRPSDQEPGLQQPPQLGYVHLQGFLRRRRRVAGPERVDQSVARDNLVGV
jgi:hypothetical protein